MTVSTPVVGVSMGVSSLAVVRIGACSMVDARGLLARHYVSGMPARVCRMLGAWMEIGGAPELAGVLTVSHPTLNDSWRERAWPGVFAMRSKRERAAKLNAEVRRISRVVVLPRWRGSGIATALIRAYLRRPQTARTEAVAAMGTLCRCFERAGMRAVECAAPLRDTKLAQELKRMRIAPELLADERVVARLSRNEEFVRAIRSWANGAGGTRKCLAHAEWLHEIAPAAARAAMPEREAVWVSG
ncbi:MAG: hypothetical protein JNM86_10445 [Phycisphaerae bacterium]|nr:hypothetical protein [Phycisphaerae bacterium]